MKSKTESNISINKRKLIIDTMRTLFKEGTAGTASVSDIAKKAGIAKGSLYYYFRSKEEVMDALIIEEYDMIIKTCDEVIKNSKLKAVDQIGLLLHTYCSSYVDPSLDEYLHMPQNAALHQKSLANILTALSPIVSRIISNGVLEGTFHCEFPDEYAEIILSSFTFLLDRGIFDWSPEQMKKKIIAISTLMEKGLQAPAGSFSFFYTEKSPRNI